MRSIGKRKAPFLFNSKELFNRLGYQLANVTITLRRMPNLKNLWFKPERVAHHRLVLFQIFLGSRIDQDKDCVLQF
jgi:hypothetical protein